MDALKIGHSVVQIRIMYVGSPFSSPHANRDTMSKLFPEADVKLKSSNAVVNFGSNNADSQISPSEHMVSKDTIEVRFDIHPQQLGEINTNIAAIEKKIDEIVSALLSSYGLKGDSESVYTTSWAWALKRVPCKNWIVKNLSSAVDDFNLADFVKEGTEVEVRPLGASLAFHTIPPGLDNLDSSQRRKLESVSGIQIVIPSSTNWDEGLATVITQLYDINPRVIPSILESLCK